MYFNTYCYTSSGTRFVLHKYQKNSFFCITVKIFTVTFDEFNASLQKVSYQK